MDNSLLIVLSLVQLVVYVLIIMFIVSLVKRKKKNKEKVVSNNNYSLEDKQVVRDYKIDSWSEFIKIVVISGICGFIGCLFSDMFSESPLVCFYFGASFPWGYSVMSRIIDEWVEFYAILSSGMLWVIMWIIKLALSVMLGCIIMPIKICTSIYNIIRSHNLDKEVNRPVEETPKEKSKPKNDKSKEEHKESNKKEVTTHTKKLKELKELLDEGVITKEEFEEKKKNILDRM